MKNLSSKKCSTKHCIENAISLLNMPASVFVRRDTAFIGRQCGQKCECSCVLDIPNTKHAETDREHAGTDRLAPISIYIGTWSSVIILPSSSSTIHNNKSTHQDGTKTKSRCQEGPARRAVACQLPMAHLRTAWLSISTRCTRHRRLATPLWPTPPRCCIQRQ